MTLDELQGLFDQEVQSLIHSHNSDDPAAFAMQFHGRSDLPVRAMAEQIACRQKAAKKLPALSQHNLLYTPLALEQSSGERTAEYKASFMSGNRVIDLSGGLGVDSIFLAKGFQEVVYCERDPLLCAVVEHNLKQCCIANVQVKPCESISLLAEYPDDFFDWIFVDPARREEGGRSIALEAASPDVVASHDMMLSKAQKVCIKASPALEISGLKTLLPALHTIIVVSVDRECKEIMLLLDREACEKPVTVNAVCLSSDSEVVIEIVGEVVFEIVGDGVVDRPLAFSVKEYFYEPDPAIIKARLSIMLAKDYTLQFVNKSVDYLTSDHKIAAFPGRTFRVIESVPYKPKSFRGFLNRHAITGASIQRRDFPLSPEELRKKFRLLESERAFLFFTRDREGHPICIYALRCFPGDEAALSGPCQSGGPGC